MDPEDVEPVVVDASVLIAGLMADGRARRVLLHAGPSFYVPPRIFEEIDRHMDEIVETAGVPRAVVEAVMGEFEDRVEVVPPALIASFIEEATRRATEADAEGDQDSVATALALDAPVWTYDDDFDRIEALETISTSEVADR